VLPEFNAEGVLPAGLHVVLPEEFVARFCHGSSERESTIRAVLKAIEYARKENVRLLFIGGSFVTAETDPRDIDCVFVCKTRDAIPQSPERYVGTGFLLDIMFCSEDESRIVDAYVRLLGQHRNGREAGVVQIDLYATGKEWHATDPADEKLLEVVRHGYGRRIFVPRSAPPGVLVTIHGLLSDADWNAEITRVASRQGWVVAPYLYGSQTPDLLVRAAKRREILDHFRQWLMDLVEDAPEVPVSVIAHSYGTFLFASYLSGWDVPPVWFNAAILTGSIIRRDFDWARHYGSGVCSVLNEVAPNDQWVRWMPDGWSLVDPLFGRSGVDGFTNPPHFVQEGKVTLFDHNNAIRRDVLVSRWMPLLDAEKMAYMRVGDEIDRNAPLPTRLDFPIKPFKRYPRRPGD
jgi:hypothetical protein